jgi:hypothetical protein
MRVFISYAWEDHQYRLLVKRLAARLRQDGIDARIDAWHLTEGLSIPEFMDREIRLADKILVVCSPQYREKVHAMEDGERITGTGWESMLVTSSIWAGVEDRSKIIPVLLLGTWKEAAPSFLRGLPFCDLSKLANFETNYRELLRRLTGQEEKAPPMGAVPEIAPEPVEPLRGPESQAPTEPPSLNRSDRYHPSHSLPWKCREFLNLYPQAQRSTSNLSNVFWRRPRRWHPSTSRPAHAGRQRGGSTVFATHRCKNGSSFSPLVAICCFTRTYDHRPAYRSHPEPRSLQGCVPGGHSFCRGQQNPRGS